MSRNKPTPPSYNTPVFVLSICLVFAVLTIMLFFGNFIFQITSDQDKLAGMGQRGDFFGGFLNPILSFLAFASVLYTIHLQRQDIAGARRDAEQQSEMLSRQNFESTFFQMLNLQNTIVTSMDFSNNRNEDRLKGRDCFKAFRSHMRDEYKLNIRRSLQLDNCRNIIASYSGMYSAHQQDLGHYFRYLYNVIRFVDESEIPPVAKTDYESRYRYMRLIRAQLSDYELTVLMYNSLTEQGAKFKKYIENYALLDNLSDGSLISSKHKSLFESSAFCSGLALKKNASNSNNEHSSSHYLQP